MEMAVTKVLVVDDFLPWHRLVRAMLEAKKDLEIVDVAVDGLEAVQKAEQLQPDLILLDIGLPTLNGIEVARRIRTLSPNSKILFVSQESSAEVVEEALRLGAWGYLLKSDAVRELLLAVDAVLGGEQFVGSRLGPHVITSCDDEHPTQPFRSDQPSPLPLQKAEARRVHEVASYRDDLSFVGGLTRFIETALKMGNPVIVIATEAHRSSIQYKLQTRGWDIAGATQAGTYISLDAGETLSTFMVSDWPDSTKFMKVAGDLIVQAAKAAKGAHPRVAACGECAPILCAQGKAEAAIQLEHLWDSVARSHDVDILCGYTLADLRRSENSHIFARICAEHSAAYSV